MKVNVDGGLQDLPASFLGEEYFEIVLGFSEAVSQHLLVLASPLKPNSQRPSWLWTCHSRNTEIPFWLETNSTYVVHVLKARPLEVPWRLLGSWHRVRKRLEQMSFVVSHIFREGNALADRLTREPVDKFEWWHHAPFFLLPFLCKDRTSDFYRFNET
ncbi:hypothetical protein ACS0TY_004945 [Phlomoides rotata]